MDCSPPGSSVHGILWSELLFHSPGDLPDPGIKPMSPTLASGFFTTSATWETINALEMKTSVLWSTGGGSQALGVGEPYSVGPVWPLGPSGYLVVENEDVGEFAPTVLAWRIPGTVGPGGLPSVGSHRAGHD